jgi:hypothetical protein
MDLWKSTGSVLTWLHKQFLSDSSVAITSQEAEDGIELGLSKQICASTFKHDIAHMTLYIPRPKVLEVVQDKKVTFADMLGIVGEVYIPENQCFGGNLPTCLICILGGTIGLFTGLSLLSVIEIIYWVYRTVVDYFSRT